MVQIQRSNMKLIQPTILYQYIKDIVFDQTPMSKYNTLRKLALPLKGLPRILISNHHNIHFNLATQQYLFEKQQLTAPILFLWRNDRNIVIGKHQNPWKQCRLEEMKQLGCLLSRRKTGGGAVYQDLGNTCFSFFTPEFPDKKYDYRQVNNAILTQTFNLLGVNAQVSGRNDMTVGGRKISGSAYRLFLGDKNGKGRKTLHHGTVLFSVDMQALDRFLNPNKKKLESKGIDSVKSRVLNLTQEYPNVNHDSFCKEITKQFSEFYQQKIEQEVLNYDELFKNNQIKANYQRLKSWEWLYGQTPNFKHSIQKKFNWGLIQINFNVEDAVIKDAKVFSDCLYPDFITTLNEEIKGMKYTKEGIQNLRTKLTQSKEPHIIEMSNELCDWIISQL